MSDKEICERCGMRETETQVRMKRLPGFRKRWLWLWLCRPCEQMIRKAR